MVAIFFTETIDSSANFSTLSNSTALRRISQQSFVFEYTLCAEQKPFYFSTLKYRKIIFDSSLSFHNVPNDCLKHSYSVDVLLLYSVRGEAAKSCYFSFIVRYKNNKIMEYFSIYIFFFFHNK